MRFYLTFGFLKFKKRTMNLFTGSEDFGFWIKFCLIGLKSINLLKVNQILPGIIRIA